MGVREQVGKRAGAINLVAYVLLAVIGVGLMVNTRADAARDHEATVRAAEQVQANRDLLVCVDRWATDLSEGLPPVRRATKRRDDAMSKAFIELQNVLALRAIRQLGAEDLRAALSAFEAYRVAAQRLDNARLAWPEPAPPSIVCSTKSPSAGE